MGANRSIAVIDQLACPECGDLGEYQGIARDGDNWTGRSYRRTHCPDCSRTWDVPIGGSAPGLRYTGDVVEVSD